jgi:putative two-component system response regulator
MEVCANLTHAPWHQQADRRPAPCPAGHGRRPLRGLTLGGAGSRLGFVTSPAALRCVVVDDEPHLRSIMVRLLAEEGLVCRQAASGREALQELEREPAEIVVTNIRMPGMDGIQLLSELRRRWPDMGVVMVTAVSDVSSAIQCLTQGALDYVAKPFQVEDVRARVRQALEKRRLILENRDYQRNLETKVAQQASRIEELFLHAVQSLAHALEAKDTYTRGHSARVASYATAIGRTLGLDAATVQDLQIGAELHDIGKIGVREEVLHKPARLSHDEYLHIMEHTVIGEKILMPLLRDHPRVLQVVRSHHEWLDGTGVPDGLVGDAVPLVARVVSVADAFDAMTTGRPYIAPREPGSALEELRAYAGRQFDRDAVAAFERTFAAASLPIPTPGAVGALHEAALAALSR